MKEIVKFPINTPVEVALQFEAGKHASALARSFPVVLA
jgi:hypothetical protein